MLLKYYLAALIIAKAFAIVILQHLSTFIFMLNSSSVVLQKPCPLPAVMEPHLLCLEELSLLKGLTVMTHLSFIE